MSVGFIRRVTDTPALAFLLAIEGVVVVDRPPPNFPQGVNTGTVLEVGEFEDGPFNAPTSILSAGDLATFGLNGLGYTYAGVGGQNPCARQRKPDGAVQPEFWCGNAFVHLVNKRFGALTVLRVDTSVGAVQFTRLASLSGLAYPSFALADGQILGVNIGAGVVSATFHGAPAVITSGAGTYPSTFAGGEQIVFAIEGVQYTAVFLATDQSHAQVVARLNLAAGYTAFAVSGANTTLTGRLAGTSGSVQIISGTTLALTATGFTAGAPTAGTGNVPNIAQVTPAQANTVVAAAVAGTAVDVDANGAIRISNTGTPGTGTILVDQATTTATAFGFPTGTTASAGTGVAGVIPAGTVVKNGSGGVWVTMQTTSITASSAGPYTIKVRPATDDGTASGSSVSTLTTLATALAAGAFAVTNNLPIGAALSEAAIDAAYVTAIQSTAATSDPTRSTNIQICARQSNAIRSALRAVAPVASNNGCFGRMVLIRPPLGTTTRAAALGSSQPGVVSYRDTVGRVGYCFPGVATFIPQIATLGLAGGTGFTADGIVDTGFDAWVAAAMSQLNPEENPGQATSFMDLITSVERGNPDVQALAIGDYEAFKAAGIMAFRQDGGDNSIQSGVTTVDPTQYPSLVPVKRRRMADFIQDTGAQFLMAYIKKLQRQDRKASAIAGLAAFLENLKSPKNPALARIEDWALDAKSANTDFLRKQGIFWIIGQVVMLPDFQVIVFDTTIGETVSITIRQ